MIFEVGDKVKFRRDRRSFTVRACNERFAVCTKPFNLRNTTLYTVVDFEQNIRGRENLIFPMGAETDEQCCDMLSRLVQGVSAVSHRNFVELDIERHRRS